MGKAPSREYSLERINVNGNYEPSNCRWATSLEQNRNQTHTVLSVKIVSEAKKLFKQGMKTNQIADLFGVSYFALYQALTGISWKEVEEEVD